MKEISGGVSLGLPKQKMCRLRWGPQIFLRCLNTVGYAPLGLALLTKIVEILTVARVSVERREIERSEVGRPILVRVEMVMDWQLKMCSGCWNGTMANGKMTR